MVFSKSENLVFPALLLEDKFASILSRPKSIRELVTLFHPVNILFETLNAFLIEYTCSTFTDECDVIQNKKEMVVFNPFEMDLLDREVAELTYDMIEDLNSIDHSIETVYFSFKSVKKIYDKILRKIVDQIRSFSNFIPSKNQDEMILNWLDPRMAHELMVNQNFQNLLSVHN